ncbi:MAG: type I 3-dehydroquinate dehydratase [Planctomycetes bacterium]|nr:type I 3-dehydroquinate dehydratase [Planctomycetota bacterium]
MTLTTGCSTAPRTFARVVATVTESTVRGALALARRVAEADDADLIEFRLDLMERPDPRALVSGCPLPVVLTNRARQEGGEFRGDRDERLRALLDAAAAGPAFVDVEHDIAASFLAEQPGRRAGCSPAPATATAALAPDTAAGQVVVTPENDAGAPPAVIVSYHNFLTTPDDLGGLLDRLAALGGDLVKFAVTPRRLADAIEVLRQSERLAAMGRRCAGIALGEVGLFTRVLAGKFGAALTYGAADAEAPGAPGQPPARELTRRYRAREVNPRTRVFAVIGDPVGQSASPAVHNALFRATGRDAVYVPLPAETFAAARLAIEGLPLEGASITMPYKEEALAAYAAGADPPARRVGAANTLYRPAAPSGATATREAEAEAVRAANTDAAGAMAALGWPRARRALVLGAGGAARAVASALVDAGNDVTLWNRTASRAAQLAEAIGGECRCAPAGAPPVGPFDLVINATPVGMAPRTGECPADLSRFAGAPRVFDMVYRPPETRFLREAAARGWGTVSGAEMFVAQAAEQFRLWTGETADPAMLRAAFQAAFTPSPAGGKGEASRAEEGAWRPRLPGDPGHLLLIGPRAAGKSTAGRLVAGLLAMPFVDLDALVEARAGRSVAEVFAAEGEASFRDHESAALRALPALPPSVVAAGGGAVLREINRERMRRMGLVVHLFAPVEALAARLHAAGPCAGGRPSLTGRAPAEEIGDVAAARDTLYRATAHAALDTAGRSPAQTAQDLAALARGGG